MTKYIPPQEVMKKVKFYQERYLNSSDPVVITRAEREIADSVSAMLRWYKDCCIMREALEMQGERAKDPGKYSHELCRILLQIGDSALDQTSQYPTKS